MRAPPPPAPRRSTPRPLPFLFVADAAMRNQQNRAASQPASHNRATARAATPAQATQQSSACRPRRSRGENPQTRARTCWVAALALRRYLLPVPPHCFACPPSLATSYPELGRAEARSPPQAFACARARFVQLAALAGMFASRPVVHPLEVEAAPADPVPVPVLQPPPGVLVKDLPGMPGTPGGLGLRVLQLLFAATSLAAMSSAVDFASVSAFSYLIATAILQCLWSLAVAILDIYALLVKRCLRNRRAVALFAIGDGITWAGSFSGACFAAGVTSLIDTDLDMCYENHCANFQTAVAMEFMCCFSLLPSFALNYYSIASSRG